MGAQAKKDLAAQLRVVYAWLDRCAESSSPHHTDPAFPLGKAGQEDEDGSAPDAAMHDANQLGNDHFGQNWYDVPVGLLVLRLRYLRSVLHLEFGPMAP